MSIFGKKGLAQLRGVCGATFPQRRGSLYFNLFELLAAVEEQMKPEKRIKAVIKVDASVRNLMTIPGIGEILAIPISREIGDITRFPTAEELAKATRAWSRKGDPSTAARLATEGRDST